MHLAKHLTRKPMQSHFRILWGAKTDFQPEAPIISPEAPSAWSATTLSHPSLSLSHNSISNPPPSASLRVCIPTVNRQDCVPRSDVPLTHSLRAWPIYKLSINLKGASNKPAVAQPALVLSARQLRRGVDAFPSKTTQERIRSTAPRSGLTLTMG